MSVDDRVPFIRILNAGKHTGDELWVLASLVRLLNVVRVWVYELEVRLAKPENQAEISTDDREMFDHSAHHLIKLIRQAYQVLLSKTPKEDLAYLETELFKFETLYLTTNLCLIINEESVEFEQDRYEFLRHSLHGVLHDLSQPLSTLISMVVLVENGDKEETKDFHKDACEVVSQCKSQLERGFELVKGSFALDELSVAQLIKISKNTMETLLKPDRISLEVTHDDLQGRVVYSKMWFRGFLANVVDNANKSFWVKGEHLGHGDFERKIQLRFYQEKLPNNKPALGIAISDTGVGFDKELLEEGFVQGKSSWDDKDLLGQGVGMAVHVEYIKKLGGEIVLGNIGDHGHIDGARMIIKLPMV